VTNAIKPSFPSPFYRFLLIIVVFCFQLFEQQKDLIFRRSLNNGIWKGLVNEISMGNWKLSGRAGPKVMQENKIIPFASYQVDRLSTNLLSGFVKFAILGLQTISILCYANKVN